MKRFLMALFTTGSLLGAFLSGYSQTDSQQVSRQAPNRNASPPYRDSQLLVCYKLPPTAARRNKIKAAVATALHIDLFLHPNGIKFRACNSCNGYVELWTAPNIQTVIHADGVRGGSGGNAPPVGEDSLAYYSRNHVSTAPYEKDNPVKLANAPIPPPQAKPGTVVIAILDTGFDTDDHSGTRYLWKNAGEQNNGRDNDGNCYAGDVNGWNFANGNNNVRDDNGDHHGSIVSRLVIKEFEASPQNNVQIMALKTHRADGTGDLFGIICAIYYAMDKGAKIINASWGFYPHLDSLNGDGYVKSPHPYLDSLITRVLRQKGILFVTASGNKIVSVDADAHSIYKGLHDGHDIPDTRLRDLWYHNFYPACLGNANNNIITAVTTDGNAAVSPTQNYSNRFVDVGVKAHLVTPAPENKMKFKVPYAGAGYVSGSSFATAVATGKIGAYLPAAAYLPGIDKAAVMHWLSPTSLNIFFFSPPLESKIRNGRFIVPRPSAL